MNPAYMPFTYLSESTARLLSSLVGPPVIYQPLKTNLPESLHELATQGVVEIRTPITLDDDRLRAALSEFTEWARMNPGKSTPGAGFFSHRQGDVPFYDETAINRIRTEIQRYHLPDRRSDEKEAEFSARLFLALAQENDRVTDRLDHDLKRFNALEKDFLETLADDDETGFDRRSVAAGVWREDPGAKLTGQRIRAWATLAAADSELPELLITTSRAVTDSLQESCGGRPCFEKLAEIRVVPPAAGTPPLLAGVLADLAGQDFLPSADLSSFEKLADDGTAGQAVTVTLFFAANQAPASIIRRMAAATIVPSEENDIPSPVGHTLIALVEI